MAASAIFVSVKESNSAINIHQKYVSVKFGEKSAQQFKI